MAETQLFLLDSNAFDLVIQYPKLIETLNELHSSGRISLLFTHIQYQELCGVFHKGDVDRFQEMMCVPGINTPIYGVVLGKTPFGLAMWSDSESASRVQDTTPKNLNDCLLIETALHYGATLVTDDDRFQKRASKGNAKWICNSEFVDMFLSNE